MRKFKVGEEVTVRKWEDMKKQYGVKNFAPELPKDSFFGSLLNEILSMEIISMPKIYELDGAPFEWVAEAFEEFWKEEEEPESAEVEEEKADMPKLENGMVVELRSGKRFLIVEFSGKQFLLSNKCWCDLNDMDFKTGKSSFDSTFDIVKVIKPYCPNRLKSLKQSEHIIWEAE